MTDRDAIVDRMLRDVDPPVSQSVKNVIRNALAAYSNRQVERIDHFGLRIWPDNACSSSMLPPEFVGIAQPQQLHSPARYYPPMRTIFIRATHFELGVFRHELAHAWDDILNERLALRPLDQLSTDQRRAAYQRVERQRPAVMHSQTARYRVTVAGRARLMTLDEMRRSYVGRIRVRDRQCFDVYNGSYQSMDNAQEFYAEGRAVFFAQDTFAQAKMLESAPELFQVFEQEAQREGLVYPNRSCLTRLLQPPFGQPAPTCDPIRPPP